MRVTPTTVAHVLHGASLRLTAKVFAPPHGNHPVNLLLTLAAIAACVMLLALIAWEDFRTARATR